MSKEQNELNQNLLEAKRLDFLHLCYKVFDLNADGKRWLETVKESLLINEGVSYRQDAQGNMIFCEKNAFFRDGQNHLIRLILANVEQYKLTMKQQAKETENAQKDV